MNPKICSRHRRYNCGDGICSTERKRRMDREDDKRRSEDDTSAALMGIALSTSFTSPALDIGSVSDWSGSGGDFSGGGASGDW